MYSNSENEYVDDKLLSLVVGRAAPGTKTTLMDIVV